MPLHSTPGIHWTFNGSTIHTLPDDPNLIGRKNGGPEPGMTFIDKYSAFGLGVTSTLVIESFDEEFEGVYSCDNGIKSKDIKNRVCRLVAGRNWDP